MRILIFILFLIVATAARKTQKMDLNRRLRNMKRELIDTDIYLEDKIESLLERVEELEIWIAEDLDKHIQDIAFDNYVENSTPPVDLKLDDSQSNYEDLSQTQECVHN